MWYYLFNYVFKNLEVCLLYFSPPFTFLLDCIYYFLVQCLLLQNTQIFIWCNHMKFNMNYNQLVVSFPFVTLVGNHGINKKLANGTMYIMFQSCIWLDVLMRIWAFQIHHQLYIIVGIYSNKATMHFYVKSFGKQNRVMVLINYCCIMYFCYV